MPQNNNSPDLSSSEFSVNSPSIPSVPVPSANPMNTSELASSNQALATRQGDAQIASRSGGGGSSGGSTDNTGRMIGGALGSVAGSFFGPIGTAVGGTLGSVFGGLFAQGGPVGYATGGQVEEDVPYIEPPAAPNPQPQSPVATEQKTGGMDPLTIGYLTGALHQAKYGGTPETLSKAAEEIKAHLGKQMPETQLEPPAAAGMAAGGVADDTQLAQVALMKAMGLSPGSEDQAQVANTQPQMQPQPQPQAQPTAPIQAKASPQPYSRGYADGGAPLQPGQAFEGDGKVEGPGGPQDDAIPAKLSNGEFVMSQPAVQFFGVDKLVKMNEQGKQGFMQAMAQVQGNQPNAQAQPGANPGAPVAPPMPQAGMMQKPPAPQAPMMQASGGPSISMKKNSGYMGL